MSNLTTTPQTLAAIAATFNLYQIYDIPEIYRHHNFEHSTTRSIFSIPNFLITSKEIEIGVFYHCKQDTNYQDITTYYIDGNYTLVKGINSNNVLMLQKDRNNKYDFYPYYSVMRKYQNINYEIKKSALKSLIKPNDIGVFTVKKLNDWLTYCDNYIKVLDTVLNDLDSANNDIKDMISAFIASIPNCKVSKYQNVTDIDTKLFRIRFTHYQEQKFVRKDIDFKGSIDDITNIETMKQALTSF